MLKIEYVFAKDIHIPPDTLLDMPFYDIIYLKDEYEEEVKRENEEYIRQQQEAGVKPSEGDIAATRGDKLPPELLKALNSVDVEMRDKFEGAQRKFKLDG